MVGGAAQALAAALGSVAGTSLTYRRGTEFAVELSEWWVGSSQFQAVTNEGNAVEQFTMRDFCGPAARLALGAQRITPRAGDLIDQRTEDADTGYAITLRWQVAAPTPTEQPFRYSDDDRSILRVHCKQVKRG